MPAQGPRRLCCRRQKLFQHVMVQLGAAFFPRRPALAQFLLEGFIGWNNFQNALVVAVRKGGGGVQVDENAGPLRWRFKQDKGRVAVRAALQQNTVMRSRTKS